MTSYFRSIFGGHPQSTPDSSSPDRSKTHHRSRSAPQNQNLNYIYAAPGSTSSASSRPSSKRGNSYATAAPSPLRYATYDSGSVGGRSNASHCGHQTQPVRVPLYRTTSHQNGERPSPYPIYTPSVSFCSSRSESNSSIYPPSSSGQPPMPPRTSSSGSVRYPDVRPALRQNHTWSGAPSQPPITYANVQPTSIRMHPLLAVSRLRNAAISYDVTYTPSSRTVLDRNSHMAVPAHTLSEPATEPPTPSTSRLVLRSDKFSWPIVVGPSPSSSKSKSKSGGGAMFYIATSSSSKRSSPHITNLDVLYALHNTLTTRVTQQEWESLGHGSRSQRKVTRAYEKRCAKMGGGWEGGVRRIDWLGSKTMLLGVDVDRTTGSGKLIFGKA